MKYVALLILLCVCLGLPTINIQHHLTLPVLDKYVIIDTQHYGFNWHRLQVYSYKVIDIRINDTEEHEDWIKNVATTLIQAKKGDIINFHLGGYGGSVDVFMELINLVKTSPATINMIVETNVYSGHAYLAASGDTLTMLPYTFMMFHSTSALGTDCSLKTGTDRGVSNAEHCQAAIDVMVQQNKEVLSNIKLFTPEEQDRLRHGHDVYITSAEYNRRSKGLKPISIPIPVVVPAVPKVTTIMLAV